MIKGVNKRIVEVSLPQSELFEKALVFMRAADDISLPEGTALAAAAECALSEALGEQAHSPAPGKIRHAIGAIATAAFRFLWRTAVIVCAVCMVRAMIIGA